jgi:hypothetical protein
VKPQATLIELIFLLKPMIAGVMPKPKLPEKQPD